MKFHVLGVMSVCAMCAFNSHAAYIVDTGAGGASGGGQSLFADQWLAGRFAIAETQTVASVEGWFGLTTEGTATATIYTDDGSGEPGSELFARQFVLDSPGYSVNHAWDGAYGLNWTLDPGTYWLSFEVRPGDTGEGYMPMQVEGAPHPLADYAFYAVDQSQWTHAGSTVAYGMRISAVPILPAVYLFASGLTGLTVIGKRKRVAV